MKAPKWKILAALLLLGVVTGCASFVGKDVAGESIYPVTAAPTPISGD